MQLASSARIPDGLLAAMRPGVEKPHQGLPSRNPGLHQGPTVCNSTTALGLQAAAVLNRVGSCSTGKERDAESGNDYFGARYYASSMGRFMSPDWAAKAEPVPYAKLDDPQSLNLYAYVGNNPLRRVDKDGHNWLTDQWEKFKNYALYGEGVTNKQLPAAFDKERSWLVQNARNANGSALSPSQVSALKGASNQQINGLYSGYAQAMTMAAGMGGKDESFNLEKPSDFGRNASGEFVPLSRLHGDATITQGNASGYDFWSKKSTEEIIESLKPGSSFGELTVKPSGTIMQGNTRTKILEERGVDINSLERTVLEPE